MNNCNCKQCGHEIDSYCCTNMDCSISIQELKESNDQLTKNYIELHHDFAEVSRCLPENAELKLDKIILMSKLEDIKRLIDYSLGPTRDVKTPKLQEALDIINSVLDKK